MTNIYHAKFAQLPVDKRHHPPRHPGASKHR
jgi:hypothetical protein